MKIKLFTIQVDTFQSFREDNPEELKKIHSKQYALECQEGHQNTEGEFDGFCTPVFTSLKRAMEYAESESDYWYYVLEYRLSLKQLEDFIQDDHDEKCLILHKVHPLVYCPELKKYKKSFKDESIQTK